MKSKPMKKTAAKPSRIVEANEKAAAGWKDRIVEEMKNQRLSQRKLAELSGLGATSIRHLVVQAETISLESARRIANALNQPISYITAGVKGQVEGLDQGTVRVLAVDRPDGQQEDALDVRRGHVAVIMGYGLPNDLHALRVTDSAMTIHGVNGHADPATQLTKGDVVIYAPESTPAPGELTVVRLGQSLVPRILVQTEDGKYQALALNASFSRAAVGAQQIVGRVVQIVRNVL